MISDTHIPQARVVLDILDRRGPMGWYRLERLAPLHPDYVDALISVREVLVALRDGGYVDAQPPDEMKILSVTPEGAREAVRLRDSRVVRPAVATINLDPSKFARLPVRRFAGRASIEGVMPAMPVGVTFLDELDGSGTGRGFVDFLVPDGPREVLQVGVSLVWKAGDVVLGTAEVCLVPVLDPTTAQEETPFDDRFAHRDVPRRRRSDRVSS